MASEELTRLSALQGDRLDRIKGVSDNLAKKLFNMGITHAGQLIGTTSVDDVKNYMAMGLGMSVPRLTDTINLVKQATAPQVAQLYEGQVISVPPLGAEAPGPELEAAIAALPPPPIAASGTLPPFVNMASQFPPIRNQAFRGTCTAFAMTALHEFSRSQLGSPVNLSEEYLYQIQKALDLIEPSGNPRDPQTRALGSWLISSSHALQRFGQCLEDTFPYNPGTRFEDTNTFRPRPPQADSEAARFTLATTMLNAREVDGIKTALASGSPVAVSFNVYDSSLRAPDTIRTGRFTLPFNGEPRAGGHAVCLVGYQDDPNMPGGGFFILRNSWERVGLEFGGTNTSVLWAQESQFGTGYGTLPYAYMFQEGIEAFSLADVPRPRTLANLGQPTLADLLTLPDTTVRTGVDLAKPEQPKLEQPKPEQPKPEQPEPVAEVVTVSKAKQVVVELPGGTRVTIG